MPGMKTLTMTLGALSSSYPMGGKLLKTKHRLLAKSQVFLLQQCDRNDDIRPIVRIDVDMV